MNNEQHTVQTPNRKKTKLQLINFVKPNSWTDCGVIGMETESSLS